MNIAIKDGQIITFDETMANRHGLIAGATGTGKTITMKLLAEEFSKQGVPVFITDIKGELSGFAEPGTLSPKLQERLEKLGAPVPEFQPFPVQFWDLLKKNGTPLRTTISEMGPLLMSRLLGLNDTQTGVLYAVFKIADENGLALLDFKDLHEMLKFVYENSADLSAHYGNISKQSVGAIQRSLLVLEQQGAQEFFQEPALVITDFLQTNADGNGIINVLDVSYIYHSPDLYSAFILYLLSELFEQLPEVGDLPLPKIVFFFEEAHLLFRNASKTLQEKVEQVVKLIRSKGVGVFFVTQNPKDIPDPVLAQLGNRIQHAMRAFTPAEQRIIRSIADSFRGNEGMNVAEEIMALQIGEAMISTLDEKGMPTPVEKAFILAPASSMDPIDPARVQQLISTSFLNNKYAQTFDSESAYEILTKRAEESAHAAEQLKAQAEAEKETTAGKKGGGILDSIFGGPSRSRESAVERMIKNTAGSIGTQVGRAITRGMFGGLLKK